MAILFLNVAIFIYVFSHFRAHFDYDQPSKGEMSFRKGDIFHVTDTLLNNVVGSWQVYRIGKFQFLFEIFSRRCTEQWLSTYFMHREVRGLKPAAAVKVCY